MLKLTYEQAVELYPIVSRRYENRVILNLIAAAFIEAGKIPKKEG